MTSCFRVNMKLKPRGRSLRSRRMNPKINWNRSRMRHRGSNQSSLKLKMFCKRKTHFFKQLSPKYTSMNQQLKLLKNRSMKEYLNKTPQIKINQKHPTKSGRQRSISYSRERRHTRTQLRDLLTHLRINWKNRRIKPRSRVNRFPCL